MKKNTKKGYGITNAINKDGQLCWYCAKACNNGCNWSQSLTPVEGWTAKCVDQEKGKYSIYDCPEFIRG